MVIGNPPFGYNLGKIPVHPPLCRKRSGRRLESIQMGGSKLSGHLLRLLEEECWKIEDPEVLGERGRRIATGQWAPSVKTSVAYVNARQNVTTTKCITTSGRQSGLTSRYQLACVISHPGQAQWIQEQSGQGGRDGGYAQTLQLFPRLIGCLTCQQQRSTLVP